MKNTEKTRLRANNALCQVLYILGLITATCFNAKAQSNPANPCRTDEGITQCIQRNPNLRQNVHTYDSIITGMIQKGKEFYQPKNFFNSYLTSGTSPTYVFPVVFYVIYSINDTTHKYAVSHNRILSQLEAMNTFYLPYNIQFCMATKDTTGTSLSYDSRDEPGIIRILSPLANIVTYTDDSALKALSVLPASHYLRVFIVEGIDGGTTGGYANIPQLGTGSVGGTALVKDGIVLDKKNVGNINLCSTCSSSDFYPNSQLGLVICHELGHYFGLYHPFQQQSDIYGIYNPTGCEESDPSLTLPPYNYYISSYNPSGSGTTVGGDLCYDTPPQGSPNGGGTCTQLLSCYPGVNVYTDWTNMMDYNPDPCRTHLTPDQMSRALATINLFYLNKTSNTNLSLVGIKCFNTLICNFAVNTLIGCTSTTFTFTAPTFDSAVTYHWKIKKVGSGTPITDTTSNVYTYSSTSAEMDTIFLTITRGAKTTAPFYRIISINNCTPILSTQGNWCFGLEALLNFQSGIPVSQPFSAINTFDGCATISDSAGNLIAYTDGSIVWDMHHNPINPIGKYLTAKFTLASLKGYSSSPTGTSTSQPAFILPYPKHKNQYVIISIPPMDNSDTSYSGNTFPAYSTMQYLPLASKDTLLRINDTLKLPSGSYGQVSEQITAIPDAGDTGYWVIVHGHVLDGTYKTAFFTFHLTQYGFSNPKISDCGGSMPTFDLGQMKASPDGRFVAISGTKHHFNSTSDNTQDLLVMSFDNAKGLLYNNRLIQTLNATDGGYYGLSFSPNSKLLYDVYYNIKTSTVYLNQFDLRKKVINVPTYTTATSTVDDYATLQLGPDNKIYLAMGDPVYSTNAQFLGYIANPNVVGSGCTYIEPNSGVYLGGSYLKPATGGGFLPNAITGLPNMLDAIFAPAHVADTLRFTYTVKAGCLQYVFQPSNLRCDSNGTYKWYFGDTTSHANDSSTIASPIHTFSGNGAYTVVMKYTPTGGGATVTITQVVTVAAFHITALTGTPSSFCNSLAGLYVAPVSPSSGLGPITYSWRTNYGLISSTKGDTASINWRSDKPNDLVQVTASDSAGCTDTASLKIDLGLSTVFFTLYKQKAFASIDTCNGFSLKQKYYATYIASASVSALTFTWTAVGAIGTLTTAGGGTFFQSATVIWDPHATVHRIKVSASYSGCTRVDSLDIQVHAAACCTGIKCGGYPVTNWQSSFKLSNLIAAVTAKKPSSLTYDTTHFKVATYDSSAAGTTYKFKPTYTSVPVIRHDTFFFHGYIQLNGSVVFDSCVFNMGYDAKIIANSGGGLVQFRNGCIFQSCGANMWDGIYDSTVSTVDGLSITGHGGSTMVQDAQNGIVIKTGQTNFETYGCKYNNNYYSIQFPLSSFTSLNRRTGIYNNTFTGSTISLAHDLVSTKSTIPLAHVYLQKAQYVLIGVMGQPFNYFEKADVGIRARSSNSFIYNNHFWNFYFNRSRPNANGIGVYATQEDAISAGQYTAIEVGAPKKVNARNAFYNSDYGVIAGMVTVSGIYKYSGDVKIYYNIFKNVSAAITATTTRAELAGGNNYSKKLFIVQDTITDCDEGITVGNFIATPASAAPSYIAPSNIYLSISNNYIHAGGYSPANILDKYGIAYTFPAQPTLIGDTIQTNQVFVKDGVAKGIRLSNCKGSQLRNNYVFLDKQVTQTSYMEGIRLEGSTNLKITCNTVKSLYDSSTSYVNKKGAIMLYSVTNSTLENNLTHNTEVGFGFSGTNTSTYMWANNVKFHFTGVMRGDWQLKAVGSMNDQIHNYYGGSSTMLNPGNQFFGKSSSHNYPGYSGCASCGALFGFGSTSTSIVHFYTRSGNAYPTNNVLSSSKLQPTSDVYTAYASTLTCTVDTSQVHVYPMASAGGVINNSNASYNSYPLINWLEKRNLYAAIKIDTTLLTDTLIEYFYDTASTGNIGNLWTVDNYIRLSGDTTIDSATRHRYIENAVSANNAVSPHSLFESNQKSVNNINLTEVMQGIALSSVDKAFIRSLSVQCVYTNGTSVYQARNIRLLFDAPVAYDDGFICNGSGKKDDDVPLVLVDRDDDAPSTEYVNDEYVKAYPNPASDIITFGYKLNTKATLKMIDLMGNVISNSELNSGYQNYTQDISRLSSGVYLFFIVNEEGHKFRGKFVVTK